MRAVGSQIGPHRRQSTPVPQELSAGNSHFSFDEEDILALRIKKEHATITSPSRARELYVSHLREHFEAHFEIRLQQLQGTTMSRHCST